MINECGNKHCFTLGKHKKLLWILTSMCGAEIQQFHPWIKPMKRVANKSLKKLQLMYPTWKESDLETLDKVISDREPYLNVFLKSMPYAYLLWVGHPQEEAVRVKC